MTATNLKMRTISFTSKVFVSYKGACESTVKKKQSEPNQLLCYSAPIGSWLEKGSETETVRWKR